MGSLAQRTGVVRGDHPPGHRPRLYRGQRSPRVDRPRDVRGGRRGGSRGRGLDGARRGDLGAARRPRRAGRVRRGGGVATADPVRSVDRRWPCLAPQGTMDDTSHHSGRRRPWRTIAPTSSSSARARSAAGRPSSRRRTGQGRDLERGLVGQGASSRAAGIVRAQGGTPATVALGRWSIDFYRRQARAIGTDSGFRELGYLILAVTEDDVRAGRERVAMQRPRASTSAWLTAAEAPRTHDPTLAPSGHRGGSYLATDGYIDPPRNVRAYSLAMQAAGVELRERTAFTGLRSSRRRAAAAGHRRRDDAGPIDDRARAADRRADAACRRAGGRAADPGRRGAPHGRGPRAARGVRRRAACRWCSTSARACTGGSRRAGCCSAGATRTRRRARPGRSTGRCTSDARATGGLRAGHPRPRAPQDLGGDDRLHARPPADPGPALTPTGRRSRASRSPRPAATG